MLSLILGRMEKSYSCGLQVYVMALMLTMTCCHRGGLYEMTCCPYCRSNPLTWIRIGESYSLSESTLTNPAAFLIDDTEEESYQQDGQNSAQFNLRYAGAPMKIEHSVNLNSADKQYFQIDLADPKYLGGILTQGGFYEETTVGFYPYTESWVTQYAMSYSNTTEQFQLMADENGNVKIFEGNIDSQGIQINALSPGVVARYIRLHPMEARGATGSVTSVNMRASAIICAREPCLNIRINCLLTDWTDWGECTCTASGCHSDRIRSIRRIQSCGGERCGALKESIPCTPPEPTWKVVAQYLGIAMAIILVIGLVVLIIYKKKQKNKVEVIVVREHEDIEDEGPVVVPKGEKAREARQRGGFNEPHSWDMDSLYGTSDRNPPSQQMFTRQLPKPPMFHFN